MFYTNTCSPASNLATIPSTENRVRGRSRRRGLIGRWWAELFPTALALIVLASYKDDDTQPSVLALLFGAPVAAGVLTGVAARALLAHRA